MSSLPVFATNSSLRHALDTARRSGARVGLVPTMGALHEGHLSLVEEASRHADFIVVSVFVNPTQFGPNEDYARYPRALDADVSACERAGASAVFAPAVSELYPDGETTRVHVGALGDTLCGPFRPGHFEGVATVVAKFFALFSPCVAVFGKKDFQQLRILERLATDLCFDVRIVAHAIVREPSGLARSSRNAYLSASERTRALSLSRALAAAAAAYAGGERRAATLLARVHDALVPTVDSIDYVSIVDPDTLQPFGEGDTLERPALLAIAVRIGATRLIDNLVLGEDSAPVVGEDASGRGTNK